MGDQAQVGERVADLGPFVEAEAADDLVAEADGDEAVFQLARLELRAHQDRHLVQRRALSFQPLDLVADAAGFLGPVPDADDAHFLARVELGPQRLAQPLAVAGDQPRGGGEDVRRRAVVLFEPDHPGAGKILLEPQDVGDFRAAP